MQRRLRPPCSSSKAEAREQDVLSTPQCCQPPKVCPWCEAGWPLLNLGSTRPHPQGQQHGPALSSPVLKGPLLRLWAFLMDRTPTSAGAAASSSVSGSDSPRHCGPHLPHLSAIACHSLYLWKSHSEITCILFCFSIFIGSFQLYMTIGFILT